MEKINYERLEFFKKLFQEVHKQIKEDYIMTNGSYMPKEDAMIAAIMAVVFDCVNKGEDDDE